jgi:steroid 5-alpha reductase family enzyme
MVVHLYQPDTTIVVIAGLTVWAVGFAFEVVADNQLKAFLRQSHGMLMRVGLWRYSRHPNYFGEVMMWWGIALIACSTPLWWVGFIGAAIITYLISFVSGIPPAEARGSLKSDWQEYKRKTSILVPWFPKQ